MILDLSVVRDDGFTVELSIEGDDPAVFGAYLSPLLVELLCGQPPPVDGAPTAATADQPPPPKEKRPRSTTPVGGCRAALLTVLAEAWPRNLQTARGELVRLREAGLVAYERGVPGVTLTAAGWNATGRTAARSTTAASDHEPVPHPEPPPSVEAVRVVDAGPMQRRPFDVDSARAAAAGAL